jgi:hypothetical protein
MVKHRKVNIAIPIYNVKHIQGKVHPSLIFVQHGRKWTASRYNRFTSGEYVSWYIRQKDGKSHRWVAWGGKEKIPGLTRNRALLYQFLVSFLTRIPTNNWQLESRMIEETWESNRNLYMQWMPGSIYMVVKLTAYLQLLPGLRISGSMLPLLHTSQCALVQF